jgi:DinB superfamily
MTERASNLLEVADGQIRELIDLFSMSGDSVLSLPCPGREKLGDGTVAACALHTADSYDRIAAFIGGRGDRGHGGNYSGHNADLQSLLDRLAAGRGALRRLADLTDEQLDSVPPASQLKFCDGQRTLEQVLTMLLNHQGHSVGALKAAVS